MLTILERHKRIFLLAGIVLCAIAIILTINPSAGSNILERGASTIITPMQSGFSASIAWIGGNFSALASNQRMVSEMQEMQETISRLQIENDRLQLAGEENATLSTLLYMQQRYASLPTMGARIIAINPNDWSSRFFIDRGTNDGLTTNMAVIGNGGLLGVIRQVHPSRAQFISIVDSDFSVAVMSTRTGDMGMASGDISLMQQGLIRMDRIDASMQIMEGDELRTSTHSSIFPPGILVGTVVSIHQNADGHTRYALVSPAVALDNLEMVLVVAQAFGDTDSVQDVHDFGWSD